jgi:NNP family nitrate/nitrite transporter-like MFS transporter
MGAGATFSVVPFVNPRALGSVAGVVGAGGNAGAVAAGFLFKGALPWDDALLVLGVAVTLASFAALTIQLSDAPAKDVAPAGLPVGDEAVA